MAAYSQSDAPRLNSSVRQRVDYDSRRSWEDYNSGVMDSKARMLWKRAVAQVNSDLDAAVFPSVRRGSRLFGTMQLEEPQLQMAPETETDTVVRRGAVDIDELFLPSDETRLLNPHSYFMCIMHATAWCSCLVCVMGTPYALCFAPHKHLPWIVPLDACACSILWLNGAV